MSKKKEEEPPPPSPPKKEDSEDDKNWDKVVYNVVFDMMKGLTLGILGTLLFSSKKAALASGLGYGAGGGYANVIMEYVYNADKRAEEKKLKEKEQAEKEKAEKEKAEAEKAKKKK